MAKSEVPYLPLEVVNSRETSNALQQIPSHSSSQTVDPPRPIVSLTQPIQFNAPTVVVQIKLGDTPMRLVCPSCRGEVVTKVVREKTEETWDRFWRICCWCPLLCFCCAIMSCCWKSTHNFRHECPQCQAHLGTYKPKMH